MGGHPYWYFTDYQPDTSVALQNLRQQEFQAGRYNPVMEFPFDLDVVMEEETWPRAHYASIEAVLEDTDADGTRSILDISMVSEDPLPCATSPLSRDELVRMFGTDQPSHGLVESVLLAGAELDIWQESGFDVYADFWDTIGRGECRHILVYQGDRPTELFFVGYSFD